MSKKFLDQTGLTYLWTKLKTLLGGKQDKVTGKGLSTNDFSNTYKTKLDGIETGANKTTVDSALSASSTNPVQNKIINTALENKVDKISGKGLSANDFTDTLKTKLDGIASGANKTVVDASLSTTSTNPVQNKVINTALGNKVDKVSGKGLSTNDFTGELKTKLEGIEEGAEKNYIVYNGARGYTEEELIGHLVSIYSELNSSEKIVVSITNTSGGSSENINYAYLFEKSDYSDFETNKTTYKFKLYDTNYNIYTASITNLPTNTYTYEVENLLNNKVDKVSGKGLSTNDFTTALKEKLEGITAGATKITVDTALSSTSTNPVQNKIINAALGNKVDKISGKGLSTNDFTTALKEKLENQANDPYSTFVEGVIVEYDGEVILESTKTTSHAKIDLSTFAKKSDVAGIYKIKGTKTFANLPAVAETNEGDVYNVSDAFTTTSKFVEGQGKGYPAGTNVVCVNSDGVKLWDVLSGFIDLSGYQKTSDLVAITNTEIDTILAS